ncbi:hypothetical protein D9M71_218380 [compost metagenome]
MCQLGQAVDITKQGCTELTIFVDALSQLTVDAIGNDQRDPAKLIHRRVQHFVSVAYQPPHGTTGHCGGDIDRGLATVELNAHACRVGPAGDNVQRVGGVAHDQRLAVAQVDVVATLALDHLRADQLGELAHGLVAGIEQVVGGTVAGGLLGDLLVELGNGGRQLIDLLGHDREVVVDAVVLFLELAGNRVEAIAQGLRAGNEQLPGSIFGRPRRHPLQGREEALQRTGDTGAAVAEQLVDLGNLVQEGGGVAVQGGTGLQLAIEKSVVDPAHVGQGGTGTDEHLAILQRGLGALDILLARVAGDVGIGNVVARGVQARLARPQSRHPDVDQTRHGSNLINSWKYRPPHNFGRTSSAWLSAKSCWHSPGRSRIRPSAARVQTVRVYRPT